MTSFLLPSNNNCNNSFWNSLKLEFSNWLYNQCNHRGVFQSLIEKHFPAPDRNKIRRLLGISMIDSLFDKPVEEPQPGSSSSSKGKPGRILKTRSPSYTSSIYAYCKFWISFTVRKAAQNAAKRGRWHDSDHSDNENDSDFSNANGSESDEEVSTDSKASDSEFESVSSEAESDEGGNESCVIVIEEFI